MKRMGFALRLCVLLAVWSNSRTFVWSNASVCAKARLLPGPRGSRHLLCAAVYRWVRKSRCRSLQRRRKLWLCVALVRSLCHERKDVQIHCRSIPWNVSSCVRVIIAHRPLSRALGYTSTFRHNCYFFQNCTYVQRMCLFSFPQRRSILLVALHADVTVAFFKV